MLILRRVCTAQAYKAVCPRIWRTTLRFPFRSMRTAAIGLIEYLDKHYDPGHSRHTCAHCINGRALE